ncbi:CHAT domain-containing protein [Gammaproteobacteria bacterium]|nr:CHAT domain-containing protein [Gammaproteobacteria bacterium]
MNKLLLFFLIILSFEIYSEDTTDNLIDIFQNNKECTANFKKIFNDENEISSLFNTDDESNIQLLKKIFAGFCDLTKIDSASFNTISENIFEDFNDLSTQIYAIHLSKFHFHFWDLPPKQIMFNLLEEAAIIEANKDKFSKDTNLINIFENFLFSIETLSESEFGDNENELKNIYSDANFLLTYLERIIMSLISQEMSVRNLERAATIIMQIRMDKMSNFNYYGSSVEQFSQREEFIKIYLKKYDGKFIQYSEIDSIFNQRYGTNTGEYVFKLAPSLEQIIQLGYVTVGVNSYNQPTESGIFYYKFIDKLLIEKLEEDPTPILLRLLASFSYLGDQYCELKDKKISKDINIPQTYLNSSTLNILKYGCSNDINFLTQSVKDNIELLDTKIFKDYNFGLYYDLFTDSILINHRAVLAVIISDDEIGNQQELDNFYSSMYEYATKLLQSISNDSEIKSFDSLGLFNLIVQLIQINSDYLIDQGIHDGGKLKKLSDLFRSKISVNPSTLKEELEAINPNENESILIAMSLGFSTLNSMSEIFPAFAPEFPEKFHAALGELAPEDEKFSDFKNNLDLIKFFLDNIDTLYVEESVESLLSRPLFDKWSVFKDLLSIEVYANYALSITNHLDDNYMANFFDKRANQLLALRPDEIAIEKFKDIFISKTENTDLANLLRQYDQTQKKFRNIIESRILLNEGIYALSSESLANLELQYKGELLNLQEELFSSRYEQDLPGAFTFDVTSIDLIQQSLDKDEVILSLLGGKFFTFSMITLADSYLFLPFTSSTSFSLEKISAYLENLRDPKNLFDTELPVYFYNNFLYPLELMSVEYPISTIYVVPDLHFSNLPLHATYDPYKNEWAIEKYKFKYLSSEKLTLYLNKKKLTSNDFFVGFANPTLSKNTVREQIEKIFNKRGDIDVLNIKNLSALPETEAELNQVSNFFQNKELFFQENAIESNLNKDAIKEADLLAFATHSVRGSNKFYNDRGLVLTPINYSEYEKDGFLSSLEIEELNLENSPTVILTACNTYESQYFQSQPFSGLASSFMEAGANSVLLSLWNIDSISAKKFNQSLFKKKESFYLDDTLQESMISMINSENYSHPHYWAPYIYLGR